MPLTVTSATLPASLRDPSAHTGVLGAVIALGGLLLFAAWVIWRFGPTMARVFGWGMWWAGWACGSQGGCGYMVLLLALGSLSWAVGTVWYARRRGRWPSALSARLFTRLLHTDHPSQSALSPW